MVEKEAGSSSQDKLLSAEKEKSNRYALLSVSDKSGIVSLAKSLDSLGFKIISTGGTAKTLTDVGLNVVPIQEITGNPESFDGRMKTISFQVESGILFDRTNPSHVKQAEELGVKKIDLVVANLYPFEQTVQNPNVTEDQTVESIDVGGPTMVRAAAKNYKNVLVVVDPKDYEKVTKALKTNSVTDDLRKALAARAFGHLSFYDAQIARHLGKEQFPEELTLPGRKKIDLRYGENPHQKAAVYFEPNTNSPLSHLQRLTGRELSYVNFTDIVAGFESVRIFDVPATAVIKHNSPCGIALGNSSAESLVSAVAADPESAFGGAVVMNSFLDIEAAKAFANFKEEDGVQIDIIAAPFITDEARDFIKTVRKTTGIYTFGDIPRQRSNRTHSKSFDGGFVAQEWDDVINFDKWKVATKEKPTSKQMRQMEIAWKFIGRIKSNTVIVVDKDLPMTRGIGSGQTSRVRATQIALEQAGKYAKGGILASDSFFPFDDSVRLAVESGIAAIVQQGGSVNDKDSIKVANKAKNPHGSYLGT